MAQIDELFSDEDIWRYLNIAYQLYSAGNAVVEALQDGRSIEQTYSAWTDPDFVIDLTPKEIAIGMALGQLLMPKQAWVEYDALRYDHKVLRDVEWQSIKETLTHRLNQRG